MQIDYTFNSYYELLEAVANIGYEFYTFRDYFLRPEGKNVILRHDVDKMPPNSLQFAKLEKERGLKASYFFRIVPESFDIAIIREIEAMGHEIGYHYEDMDLAKGDVDKAYLSFQKNLKKMRAVASIKTICMHGSPLSKFDNRDLWNKHDYRELGIIGEPYFDLDYSKIFYITDTGRKWNNKDASIRDKVETPFDIEVRNTAHFIELVKAGKMPDQMMINTHPQRWNDAWGPWVRELVGQSLKNQIKQIISRRYRG